MGILMLFKKPFRQIVNPFSFSVSLTFFPVFWLEYMPQQPIKAASHKEVKSILHPPISRVTCTLQLEQLRVEDPT